MTHKRMIRTMIDEVSPQRLRNRQLDFVSEERIDIEQSMAFVIQNKNFTA